MRNYVIRQKISFLHFTSVMCSQRKDLNFICSISFGYALPHAQSLGFVTKPGDMRFDICDEMSYLPPSQLNCVLSYIRSDQSQCIGCQSRFCCWEQHHEWLSSYSWFIFRDFGSTRPCECNLKLDFKYFYLHKKWFQLYRCRLCHYLSYCNCGYCC